MTSPREKNARREPKRGPRRPEQVRKNSVSVVGWILIATGSGCCVIASSKRYLGEMQDANTGHRNRHQWIVCDQGERT